MVSDNKKRVDYKSDRKKRKYLMTHGFFITDIYRHAVDACIVSGVETGKFKVEELLRLGINLDDCIKAQPPEARRKEW